MTPMTRIPARLSKGRAFQTARTVEHKGLQPGKDSGGADYQVESHRPYEGGVTLETKAQAMYQDSFIKPFMAKHQRHVSRVGDGRNRAHAVRVRVLTGSRFRLSQLR
jgi:hypothetical protein